MWGFASIKLASYDVVKSRNSLESQMPCGITHTTFHHIGFRRSPTNETAHRRSGKKLKRKKKKENSMLQAIIAKIPLL